MRASDTENGFGSRPRPSGSPPGAQDSPSSYSSPPCDLSPGRRGGRRGTNMRFIGGNGGRVSVIPEPSGCTTSVVCSEGGEVRVGNTSRKSPRFPTPGSLRSVQLPQDAQQDLGRRPQEGRPARPGLELLHEAVFLGEDRGHGFRTRSGDTECAGRKSRGPVTAAMQRAHLSGLSLVLGRPTSASSSGSYVCGSNSNFSVTMFYLF